MKPRNVEDCVCILKALYVKLFMLWFSFSSPDACLILLGSLGLTKQSLTGRNLTHINYAWQSSYGIMQMRNNAVMKYFNAQGCRRVRNTLAVGRMVMYNLCFYLQWTVNSIHRQIRKYHSYDFLWESRLRSGNDQHTNIKYMIAEFIYILFI